MPQEFFSADDVALVAGTDGGAAFVAVANGTGGGTAGTAILARTARGLAVQAEVNGGGGPESRAVYGRNCNAGDAIVGEASEAVGVRGITHGPHNGVVGQSGAVEVGGANGVAGFCGHVGHSGVWGHHNQPGGQGVSGSCAGEKGVGVGGMCDGALGVGILGTARRGDGVVGRSWGAGKSGVGGIHEGAGYGVYAQSSSVALRAVGRSEMAGDLDVSGSITVGKDILLPNADIAEDFDYSHCSTLEPGMVAVVDAEGVLEAATQEYDTRVAGIVSGAGVHRPAIVLDHRPGERKALPIALMGKAYCYVDASFGPIRPGDLLTTSTTPGHAMKVTDKGRSFGSIIGKALQPHADGLGLIPVLVMNM